MRGQPAHYLEHDELIAGNNYSYLKLSEKLKKDRKTKKKERTEERLRKRKYTHSNASTPFEQIFIICGIFFSWKRSDEAKRRQRRVRNKRRRLEIKQIKKNAHEELVQEKKEKTDNRRKTIFYQKKKNQEKFHQLWRQTEREKERLLHLQMKNKTKSINSSDSAVVVTKSFLEIPREQKVHVNMDSDSKNLITLWEGKFGKVTLDLPFI